MNLKKASKLKKRINVSKVIYSLNMIASTLSQLK